MHAVIINYTTDDYKPLIQSFLSVMGKSQIKSNNQIPDLIYQIFKSPGQITNQIMGSNHKSSEGQIELNHKSFGQKHNNVTNVNISYLTGVIILPKVYLLSRLQCIVTRSMSCAL
jgi:hypothetical protein